MASDFPNASIASLRDPKIPSNLISCNPIDLQCLGQSRHFRRHLVQIVQLPGGPVLEQVLQSLVSIVNHYCESAQDGLHWS